MTKYALTIDHELCWGCKACEVACKQENNAKDGVKLIAVTENGPKEINGKLEFSFHINMCRHCDEPPCMDACPEEAIKKREDGIVVMDYDLCTGCQACMDVCHYDAIAFDEDQGLAQSVISAITGWIKGSFPPAPIMCVWLTVFLLRIKSDLWI